MAWFLYLISLIWIAAGSFLILYTGSFRSAVDKVLSTVDRKLLAIVPFVFGVLLVISATHSHHPGIIRIFGALAMIKGVFVFLNPENLYRRWVTWYQEALSDQALRLCGIIIVILGTAILSWVT